MARRRTARLHKAAPPQPPRPENDATPERIAKDESELVPAAIGGHGERRGVARRFRASHLDRLHKSGCLNYVQWYAGNHYRETHSRCSFALTVVASYGERTGAAANPGDFGYGLPRAEAQARAREAMAFMRAQWPQAIRGFMDRLLLHDELPGYRGRKQMHCLTEIRNGLDDLARYLRLT